MAAPRHLWSGDWRNESAAAAEQLPDRRRPTDAPAEPQAPEPPAGPSALERGLRALRNANTRSVRRAALIGVAALAMAGAAFALVSAITTRATPSQPAVARTPVSTSGTPWLGVDTTSFPVITGAMIVDVAPGSPADAAGLEPGEVITGIDNHPVQTPADLDAALAGLHAGQQVQIQYQLGPGQSTYTTQVTLRSRPAGP
jgi:predicted metalloprotease with PDZ domain